MEIPEIAYRLGSCNKKPSSVDVGALATPRFMTGMGMGGEKTPPPLSPPKGKYY